MDEGNINAASGVVNQPVLLVEIGFDTPVHYSSADDITWDGKAFQNAAVRARISEEPQISIYNEGTSLGDFGLSEGVSGRSIKLWRCHAYENKNLLRYTNFDSSWLNTGSNDSVQVLNYERGPARFLRETTTTGEHSLRQNLRNADVADSVQVTCSVYVKQHVGSREVLLLYSNKAGTEFSSRFNINTGVIDTNVGDSFIESLGDGWYRIGITESSGTGASAPVFTIGLHAGSSTYTGDGTSGILVSNPQVEANSNATFFQPVYGNYYTLPGTAPLGYTEPALIFDGVISSSRIQNDQVLYRTRRISPFRVPRHRVSNPLCNHLPRKGQRFETPRGIVVLGE